MWRQPREGKETCGPTSGAAYPCSRRPPARARELGRRSFLGLGAALTGSLAFGARPGHAETAPLPRPRTRRGRNRSAPASSIGPMAGPPTPKPASSGATCRGSRPAPNRRSASRRCRTCTASSRRTACSSSAIMPDAPDIDPDQHRLMIHGLVERPLILTMKDIVRFPQVSRIHFIECPANGGMEWRAAQLNSLQFTHGMIGCAEWTGVRLSTLLGRSRHQEGSEMGDGRRRRRRAHEPQPAARQMPRRLPRGLCARTARRCGPNRAIRCGWWCRAGKATSTSNGCAGSSSATSRGSRAKRPRNTPT